MKAIIRKNPNWWYLSPLQAQRLQFSFIEQLAKYGEGEIPVKEVTQKLMKDTVKADENMLPHICSLDWEFNLSSIFVEVETPLVCFFLESPKSTSCLANVVFIQFGQLSPYKPILWG